LNALFYNAIARVTFIQKLTKQCTQLRNQLHSLLYTANPELLRFCQDGMPKRLFTLLLKYPIAANLKKARAKTLAKIAFVTLQRAQQLIANANRSIASATNDVSDQLVIATAKQILQLKNTIDAQTKLIVSHCRLPEVNLLKTFDGIGNCSAIGICMHKILRIIYGMLKNNTAFDPKIDMANKQRMAADKDADFKKDKNRRFQSYDAKGPISRRQRKKRMEREQSQSVIVTKRRITTPVPLSDILPGLLASL
jgi:hypothetical protein